MTTPDLWAALARAARLILTDRGLWSGTPGGSLLTDDETDGTLAALCVALLPDATDADRAELRYGVLKLWHGLRSAADRNFHLLGAGGSPPDRRTPPPARPARLGDEPSAWQENAVRAMEDRD